MTSDSSFAFGGDVPNFIDFTWNTLLDYVFYNVDCLNLDERRQLARIGKKYNERPGTVVIVQPNNAGKQSPRIQVVMDPKPQKAVDRTVDTVVMAGVGSSILGTAALAQDVADLLQKPVAGVVAGTGAEGIAYDSLMGYYFYGTINQVSDFWHTVSKELGGDQMLDTDIVDFSGLVAEEADPAQQVLQELIARPHITRVIGHSKGSLELGAAINGLSKEAGYRKGAPLSVGTLGTVAYLQPDKGTCQILGGIDLLGLMNSRADVPRHTMPNRWHSLNPRLPLAMSLKDDVWGKFGATGAFS